MDARRDPPSLYSYSSHSPTWNPSDLPTSHSLLPYDPQQCSHPQLPRYAIHQGRLLDLMMPQDYAHGHFYGRGPDFPLSSPPRQSMPSIVPNPHLYTGRHVPKCEQSKGPQFQLGLVSYQWHHDQGQTSLLPTPPSNDSPWIYRLQPLEGLPTSSPGQQKLSAASATWGVGPSGTPPPFA